MVSVFHDATRENLADCRWFIGGPAYWGEKLVAPAL